MFKVFIIYDLATGQVHQAGTHHQDATLRDVLSHDIAAKLDKTLGIAYLRDEDVAQLNGPLDRYIFKNGYMIQQPQKLDEAKTAKFRAIDGKTSTLIAQGFTYNGLQFSLSLNAQARMTGYDQVRSDMSTIYPITWNTIDDVNSITLMSSSDLHKFVIAGIGYYRSIVDAGTKLKAQVRAATTTAQVDAIADSR